MSRHLPSRVPLTPLDSLRALLSEHGDAEGGMASRLLQLVQELKRQALPELARRLARPETPRSVRRAIIQLVPRTEWPEWVEPLQVLLEQEEDLGLFDEACQALGSLASHEAWEALEELRQTRKDPDHQVILNRERVFFTPQQSFDHYLSRLMEGQGNQRLALQGAKFLAALSGPAELDALLEAHRQGDALTQRLVLRLLAGIRDPRVGDWLAAMMRQSREELLDNRLVLEDLQRVSSLPRPSARQALLNQVKARFAERAPQVLLDMEAALGREGGDFSTPLDQLRGQASGPYESFLMEGLTLVLEGKIARFTAFCSELESGTEARQAQLATLLDQLAEAMAWQCHLGEMEAARVLDSLGACFRGKAGGDGLLQAYLRLLPASDTAALDLILAEPDMGRRSRCLDALGSREDDLLTPFFLKAMQDPIVEVGELAIHHLGKLPSSFSALMGMFESGQREQMRMAIRVFGENQTRMAAEPLLELIQKDVRDDLLVEAVEALANIRYPAGVPVYLDLLHDGKPLNLQLALTRALGRLAQPEASIGLLQKAHQIKQPQVLILVLEGALDGFPSFEHPLPLEHLPALLQLVDRCCDEREGEGQRHRALLAMEDLYVFDKDAYELLKDRLSDFLFAMRTKEAWDRENNDRVAAVIKELTRRSGALGLLARKESQLRGQIQRLPEPGAKRADALLAIREALHDPELILRPEMASELGDMVLQELRKKAQEWRETAHLCEIAGLVRMEKLVEPVREVYLRATGLGLKSSAREALTRMGLREEDLNRRPPVRSVLVLEPSGFFRKRLMSSLAVGGWTLLEAGNRREAEALLTEGVDVILSERQDAEGDLEAWLQAQWGAGRCRGVLLSTANRDPGDLGSAPWILGVHYKPYPMGQIIHALES